MVQVIDDVAIEEKVDKKDDFRTMLNSALASFDLTDAEQSDLSGILAPLAVTEKSDEKNVMVHFGDGIGQRLAGLDVQKTVTEIEEEMLKLAPCTALFTMTDPGRKRSAQSHLADIDHQLASEGNYSQSQMKRILLQMSTEAIPLSNVDDAGSELKIVHQFLDFLGQNKIKIFATKQNLAKNTAGYWSFL